jgi:hypothetical protein
LSFHEQMQNSAVGLVNPVSDDDGLRRPDVTAVLTRGVSRLFGDLGFAPLAEFRLPNGRRADIAGLCAKGRLIIAEIKSCQADFDVDQKWAEYLPFCDEFYFAVSSDFPMDILPADEGLIIADGFGGAIIRPSSALAMAAARRKAITLRFARQAAARSAFILEELKP